MVVSKSDVWRLKNRLDAMTSTCPGVVPMAASLASSVTTPPDTAGV